MVNLIGVPQMPYKIVEYLVEEADENFWKLLYYNDIDALSHDNLTPEQKVNLIWTTQPQEECNIFFSRLIRESIPESKSIIKIYNGAMTPIKYTTPYACAVTWVFEFLWGGDLAVVYDDNGIPCNRGDMLMQYFMSTINGKYIGGVGNIAFDTNLQRYTASATTMGNSKSYTGHIINIPVPVGGDGSSCNC